MKLVEPKEAPVEKQDKDMFDPKNFLAKVGAGKQVLEFHKNQHVFEQGDVAETVFYIQKGKVKLRRRLHEWSCASHRNHDGDGRLITAITKAAMIAAIHDEPQF
jgi:CRP/FNR family transcriptional regulator, cyclic AMP receptor protein